MSTGKLHKSSQTMEECIAFIRFRCNSNSSACICMSHTHTFVCCSYFAIDFATLWCVACDEWETTTASRRRHMVVRLAKGANKEACQHTYLHFSISYETDSAQLVQPPPLVLASQHIATGSATQTAAQHTHKRQQTFSLSLPLKIGRHFISLSPRRSYLLFSTSTYSAAPSPPHSHCCYRCSSNWHFDSVCIRQSYFLCLESFPLYETPYRARGVESAA